MTHFFSRWRRGRTLAKARQRGFSLIEIALVLVIVGLALGAGLSILSAKTAQARIDATKTRAEAVHQALVAFVSQNYRLPCPAAPGIVQGAAGYNVERVTGAPGAQVCTNGTGLVNNIGGATPAGVSRGTVPCVTLGLAEEACLDAWAVRFTYFVQNSATRLTVNTVSGMGSSTGGSMTVHKITPPAAATPTPGLAPTGNQINACSTTAGDNSCNLAAVAMVISHGANRGGGFVPTSAAALPTAGVVSAYELENTNNNVQFIQNDYVESGANSFDDVVVPIAPRDVITSLSQTGAVKQPNVFMNERFVQIKIAILNQMFNPAPIAISPQGVTPDRGLRLAPGSVGPALVQVFPPSVAQTQYCPAPVLNTLQLPLATDVQALSIASGLRTDVWGNPVRYKLFATNGVSKPGTCIAVGTPTAHLCAPPPNPTIRSGQCQTAFVLVSYGPNGIANTGVATDDDIFYAVTNQEVTDFVQKSGGW
jgi:prepilin-type N-terminal cleavage/methylation domain-containing protein